MLVSSDNGHGMTATELEQFAKRGLQQERDLGVKFQTPYESYSHKFVNGELSQSGVGGKASAMHAAKMLFVITKAAGCTKVLEFVKSAEEELRRQKLYDRTQVDNKTDNDVEYSI
jgi:hypothetical protein